MTSYTAAVYPCLKWWKMTFHSCIWCAKVLLMIWEGQNNLYILFKVISLFSVKKNPKINKQKTKTINQNQATTNQPNKIPKHNEKPLNSMYGAVPTRNLLTLLKFSYVVCLNFSIFYLNISKEVMDFATWWCWSISALRFYSYCIQICLLF